MASSKILDKNGLLTVQTIFLLLTIFLTVLPQTQAEKPSPINVTLTSPNPLAYVSGSGVLGGMYGATVAYSGNYIFVHGEGNFYVYTAKGHALVKTIAGSTIAVGEGYVAIGNYDYASTSSKVDIYKLNNLRKVITTLTAPEDAHVGFGLSMAISNGKMLISDVGTFTGQQNHSGDVYVYSLPSFTYTAKLEQKNPEQAEGAPFGYKVAFCGNHIVVGSPDETINGAIYCGNVYIYNSETYAYEKTISNPDAVAWGMFGSSIAVTGNKIWIGEPGYTFSALSSSVGDPSFTGKVYCYTADGEQVTSLNTQKPAYGGFFGRSIAANDDYLVVSAPGESVDVSTGSDSTTITYAGQVYVYTPSGTYIKTLTSVNPQIYGLFGSSVAIGEDFFVIGAPEETATVRYRSSTLTYFEAGRAYVIG